MPSVKHRVPATLYVVVWCDHERFGAAYQVNTIRVFHRGDDAHRWMRFKRKGSDPSARIVTYAPTVTQ